MLRAVVRALHVYLWGSYKSTVLQHHTCVCVRVCMYIFLYRERLERNSDIPKL